MRSHRRRFFKIEFRNPRLQQDGTPCVSGKIVYLSRGAARNAVAHNRSRQMYFYRCPDCGNYHLTSKSAWGTARRA